MPNNDRHDIKTSNPFFKTQIEKLCDEIRKYDDDDCEDSVYIYVALTFYLTQKKRVNPKKGENDGS